MSLIIMFKVTIAIIKEDIMRSRNVIDEKEYFLSVFIAQCNSTVDVRFILYFIFSGSQLRSEYI